MRGGEGTAEAVGWRRYDGEVHGAGMQDGRAPPTLPACPMRRPNDAK